MNLMEVVYMGMVLTGVIRPSYIVGTAASLSYASHSLTQYLSKYVAGWGSAQFHLPPWL